MANNNKGSRLYRVGGACLDFLASWSEMKEAKAKGLDMPSFYLRPVNAEVGELSKRNRNGFGQVLTKLS
ncbi:hypothetical protein EFD62_15385 [Acetivibrio mesophilus]|uniref:Uncharacterized protein n=1 Tax=Acetivibrio mesophilus TaxID=2487273 RepID=A0A4Q0I4K4_9FIRM|nr:hypothetical protein A7W90_17850 [Clostridium sp. Bc-iso-3]RXE57852.1 hypothetical protein EFD62_15385 [Acetivibrio mesophilus]